MPVKTWLSWETNKQNKQKRLSSVDPTLPRIGDSTKLTSALKERCSGGCNVFHVLATLSKPQDPQSSSSTSSSQGEKRGVAARTTPRGGMLREIMKQAMALASGSGYPHPPMGNYL